MGNEEEKLTDREKWINQLLDEAFSKTGAEFDAAIDALPKEVTEDPAFIMVASSYKPS
jgi:hypothetical protein